mmetsp:Transcript_28146/g.71385  ORF Transcript_28146/g.71385 Transcript_28146/m.71385 type:complete len:214 (-) Transcript_28146:2068-2709(-)
MFTGNLKTPSASLFHLLLPPISQAGPRGDSLLRAGAHHDFFVPVCERVVEPAHFAHPGVQESLPTRIRRLPRAHQRPLRGLLHEHFEPLHRGPSLLVGEGKQLGALLLDHLQDVGLLVRRGCVRGCPATLAVVLRIRTSVQHVAETLTAAADGGVVQRRKSVVVGAMEILLVRDAIRLHQAAVASQRGLLQFHQFSFRNWPADVEVRFWYIAL